MKKEKNKTVAKRLVILRGKQSRATVANALGVSKSAIAMYEQGKRIPRDDIKVKYAKYFKTTVESIFFAQ